MILKLLYLAAALLGENVWEGIGEEKLCLRWEPDDLSQAVCPLSGPQLPHVWMENIGLQLTDLHILCIPPSLSRVGLSLN